MQIKALSAIRFLRGSRSRVSNEDHAHARAHAQARARARAFARACRKSSVTFVDFLLLFHKYGSRRLRRHRKFA